MSTKRTSLPAVSASISQAGAIGDTTAENIVVTPCAGGAGRGRPVFGAQGGGQVGVGAVGRMLLPDFFAAADTVRIARELVGCVLCRRLADGSVVRWVLTETEAYDGPEDKACHAHKGRTARTEVMFGEAGRCYVYLCYGVHWLLNIVTGPVDYPAAVLIRGAGPLLGPGRVTKALEIGKALNTRELGQENGIWVEAPAQFPVAASVAAAARIGVAYAGPDWANRPYRFTLQQG